jgi:outer membrane protein TolC
MKPARLVCALLLLPLVAGAQTRAPGASVDDLLAWARSHNPELAAQRLEAEAAAERIEPAGALPDPSFRAELRDITRGGEQNATLSPSRVGSTRYVLSQPLPFWGKRGLKEEIARAGADEAGSRFDAAWRDLAARLKGAYADYWRSYHSLLLTREISRDVDRLAAVGRQRYAQGQGSQADALRAETERSVLASEALQMEQELHHSQIAVNTLLARPSAAPLAEPEQLRPLPASLDYATLEQRLRQHNPQLAMADAQLHGAEKNRELTYRNRWPDLNLGVAPIQYGGSVREWELMLELNIPLQQSSRRAQEREAEKLLEAAQARRSAASNQVLADLASGLSSLDTARQNEQRIGDALLPQTELIYRSALAGYEVGRVDFATLLDSQRQLRRLRIDRLRLQAEQRQRLADIERLVGEDL